MDALMTQKFYFRVNVYDAGLPEIKELSIKDYVCGCVIKYSLKYT
jgi:hypothetical protein